MKIGKFIQLGYHKNVKMGYGSVDCKNLKTVYLKLNSWVTPMSEIDYDGVISKARKSIINKIYLLQNNTFKRECIVDIDIKTKGVKLNKKSYMDIEITLYTTGFFEIKNKSFSIMVQNILKSIIDKDLNNEQIFNFSKSKND